MSNRSILRSLILSAAVLGMSTAAWSDSRPLSVDDMLDIVSVGGNIHLSPDGFDETVLMSPDGEHVFYTSSVYEWESNGRASTFYFIDTDGSNRTAFPQLEGGDRFQFSPKGSYLSFVRSSDGVDRIFAMSVDDGEIRQISNNNGDVFAYDWVADESGLVFAADDPRTAEEQKRYEMGEDWFFVDEGPHGRIAARWRNLWHVKLGDVRESAVTSGEYIVDELDVSPDGSRIAFVARPDNRRNYPHTAELYVVDAAGGDVKRLTDNLAPESKPRWSPDGERLAYYAPSDENYALTKGYLWVMDVDSGKYRQLHSQSSGDIYALLWSVDGESLLVSEQQGMDRNLFRIDIDDDSMTSITKRIGTTNVMALSADQTQMVFSYTDFNTPMDLFTANADMSNVVRLTDANPWMRDEIALGETRVVRWKSSDGLEIEGILALPAGYDGKEKLPLLVQIHGGPPQQFANEFYQDYHVFNGLGYAVLGGNVRGSSGYGDAFIKALIGEVSKGEYEDVMAGVDHVIDMGIADPERLVVRGWSWGGVLSSWVVTQTDRFKAASIGAGVMSWLSEMGPGFNWDLTEWYMDKSHWEDPAGWREVSSLTYVQNVTTPSLIIHGDADWYSSYNQSLIFFTGLRDVGKAPVRFISYPGRGHEYFDPWGQRARYEQEIRWFQKYTNGIDWRLPERQ